MKASQTTTYRSLDDVHSSVDTTQKRGILRSLLAFIGPAYLISVGYMDPGNWATDIAGGSAFGYSLLWVLLLSNVVAILLQNHAARLGIVRGRDLAQACKEGYPRWVQGPLWVLAELAIAATDLAEVLGFAIGLNLLFDIPLLLGVVIAALDSLLLLLLINYGIRKLEALIISLVILICSCFFVEIFIAQPQWSQVAQGLVPSFANETALYIAIGIIGATIMPHNLYLHSALVQTRKFEASDPGRRKAIRFNLLDSVIALNIAFLVNASILVLAGTVFHQNGLHNITEIQDAHQLLEPLLGSTLAPILFAIALIASGQSSTLTGTLAGQIVMEGFLRLRITPWLRRLITRMIAVIPAVLVISIGGESKVGELLILSQVILSLQLGFAVVPLIYFVSDRKHMGSFAIGPLAQGASWLAASLIVALNLRMVFEELQQMIASGSVVPWVVWGVLVPLTVLLLGLLIFITAYPLYLKHTSDRQSTPAAVRDVAIHMPSAIRRIAVALDFSPQDSRTLSQALATGGTQSVYILIHVVESAGARMVQREIQDYETQQDKKQLDHYAEQLVRMGFQVETHLGFGQPEIVIPRVVQQTSADLLIMGTHGHRGIKDLIFGETINKVRHRITIPLLTVK